MFDHNHNPQGPHGAHAFGRGRQRRDDRRDDWRDVKDQMRAHLRRNLAHHGRGGAGTPGTPGNPGFNFGELFGGPGGRGGRGRPGVRRGEVRTLILGALAEQPMHGYEVIQALEAKSRGMWRPSAGSIYPTLQQLSDEGLVTSEEIDGRRTYTLTDEGRKTLAESPAATQWTDADAGSAKNPDIRRLAMELAAAVIQVHRVGSAKARRDATSILTDARKQMYRLLSEDEDATDDSAG